MHSVERYNICSLLNCLVHCLVMIKPYKSYFLMYMKEGQWLSIRTSMWDRNTSIASM